MNFKAVQELCSIAMRHADALYTAYDTVEPENLSPSNYEGDGESFAFAWSEEISEESKATFANSGDAQAIFLGAFWAEIESLQGGKKP